MCKFYSGSIQCEVLISPSFYVEIYYNGGDRDASDGWNDLVGTGRAGSTFVFLCLTFKMMFGFDTL